jgi:ABC-type amino acid transport substrate-binding protein
MKKLQKSIFVFVLLVIFAGILSGCNPRETKSFNKMEDFENAKIGVLTGSSFDILAKEYFPKADRFYFMNISDGFSSGFPRLPDTIRTPQA